MQAEKKSSISWFISIVAIIAATNLAIFFDVPVLRQLLGIIFLTIIPGLLILFLLKLDKLALAEKIVLTVGISVAFLMIFGWSLNQASLAVGYMSPLSTGFLTISLSLALGVLCAYHYEFVYDQETFSAKWLKEHMGDSLIRCFEERATDKLKSQGRMSSKLFTPKQQEGNYIYLTYNNVVYGEFGSQGESFSMSQYREELDSENKLYSNGGSEIYK